MLACDVTWMYACVRYVLQLEIEEAKLSFSLRAG